MTRVWAPVTAGVLACAPQARPPGPAMTPMRPDWRAVTAFLDSAVAAGAAPGAVLGVSVGRMRFIHPTGQLGADDPRAVTPSTVYDLASLTKVVGLTTGVMLAVEDGASISIIRCNDICPVSSAQEKTG